MIEVNLTGAVGLIQPSKTDYVLYGTQILTTLLTIGATLAGIGFKGYLDGKSEENKRLVEQNEKLLESQKNAYQDFLAAFSAPIPSTFTDYDLFDKMTLGQLKSALDAIDFGNVELNQSTSVEELGMEIKTLQDLIKAIFAVRFNPRKLDRTRRIDAMLHVSHISTEDFGAIFLDYLINGKKITFVSSNSPANSDGTLSSAVMETPAA